MDAQEWLRSACEAVSAAQAAEVGADTPGSSLQSLAGLLDMSNSDRPVDYAAVLLTLSELLADPTVSSHIARQFWAVLPDLIARWIGRSEATLQVWEARLVVVAATCGSVPQLWPYVYLLHTYGTGVSSY